MKTADTIDDRPNLPTARDVAGIVFRHSRLSLGAFAIGSLAVIVWAFVSVKYEAEMKILVRRERVDPMITPQANAPPQFDREQVSEEDLNSEVELLRSSDLLRKVVVGTGLQAKEQVYGATAHINEEDIKIAKAVKHLASRLAIRPLQKTNLISIKYSSSEPHEAASVLDNLGRLYLEKHLQVHRPSGELDFFDQQASHYHSDLEQAEKQLSDFTRHKGIVVAQQERDLLLQKINQFDAAAKQTQSDIAQTTHRIRTLEAERKLTAPRSKSQEKKSDNSQLLEIMKSTLLTLELKRSDLLAKYESTYRPVQDLEKQIAETRASIQSELKAPVREDSTDRNQTYEWISAELAKARGDLSGLKAKAVASGAILKRYRKSAQELELDSITQSDLLRDVKAQEDSYLLYLQKREEARINDALDLRGILNVAVAEQPTVPSLPTWSPSLFAAIGLLGSALGSILVAFVADLLDPSFQTSAQLTRVLGTTVLAVIPRQGLDNAFGLQLGD